MQGLWQREAAGPAFERVFAMHHDVQTISTLDKYVPLRQRAGTQKVGRRTLLVQHIVVFEKAYISLRPSLWKAERSHCATKARKCFTRVPCFSDQH
jgi:hypothetical protein